MKPRNRAAERTPNALMSAQTCARIIDATIAALAELGYAGTTMSDIARRCRLTRAALVYHFESKYVLLAAVVNAIYDYEAERFARDAPHSLTPRERLLAVQEVVYALSSDVRQTALIELHLAASRDPDLRVEVAPVVEQREAAFDEAWREVVEDVGGDRERLNLLRDLAVSVYRGMTITRSLTGDSPSFGLQHAVLRRLLLDAI
jgi:AcrR family transcriptional regulator